MSVLVKGMSIPDNCESCAFETGFGFCLAKSDNFCGYTNYSKRPDWCPLVEVPTPHGDLIDRDEVRNDVFRHLSIKGEENLLPAEKSIFENLIKAKAVVKAEGE